MRVFLPNPKDSIRRLMVKAVAEVAGLLDAKDKERVITPILKNITQDISWRVREGVADHILEVGVANYGAAIYCHLD